MSSDTSPRVSLLIAEDKLDTSATGFLQGDLKALDVGLVLIVDRVDDPPVSPNESKRIRRKVDRHILPLLFFIYTGMSMLFAQ